MQLQRNPCRSDPPHSPVLFSNYMACCTWELYLNRTPDESKGGTGGLRSLQTRINLSHVISLTGYMIGAGVHVQERIHPASDLYLSAPLNPTAFLGGRALCVNNNHIDACHQSRNEAQY